MKLEKRMADVYASGTPCAFHASNCYLIDFFLDPPIKRLAQRHIYLGTDAIADRDLGFAIARRSTASSLGRTETSQSLFSGSQPQAQPATKRAASPDYRKRDDGRAGDYSGGHKRVRPSSPPPARGPDRGPDRGPERERDGGRWDGPQRRRFSPPPGPPGRGRDSVPPPRGHDRDDDKPRQGQLPNVLSWFIGELPTPASFDGEYLPS